jgi:hypothetical protein
MLSRTLAAVDAHQHVKLTRAHAVYHLGQLGFLLPQ